MVTALKKSKRNQWTFFKGGNDDCLDFIELFINGRPHQFPFQYCRSSQRDAAGAESKDGTLRGVSVSFACSLSVCCQSMFAIIAISLLFSPQRAYLKIMPERVELLFVFSTLYTQSLRFAFMDFGVKLSIMYRLSFEMHLYQQK